MIVDKLSAICKQRNTNFKQLEIEAKLCNGSIRRWDTSIPSIDKVLRVCSVLQVPLSAVVDDPYASAPVPSSKENSLLSSFRELNQQGQVKVLTYIDDLLRNPENLAGDNPAQVV